MGFTIRFTVTPKQWRFVHRITSGEPVPAEPFLYVTTWLAALFVLGLSDWAMPDIGLCHPSLVTAWTILMLSSPLQAGIAWGLITYGRGRLRVFGMWQRLGGNVGLFLGLLAFVLARLWRYGFSVPDAALFGVTMVFGVAAYTSFLVLRDITALLLLERVTTELHDVGV